MMIEVVPGDPTPPYEQIRSQVATMIADGTLPEDFRLPSIRQLANDLGVAPGTVARAYRALEESGVVTSRVGRGTTVAGEARSARERERQRRLAAAAQAFAEEAGQLGVPLEHALAVVRARLSATGPTPQMHVADLGPR